ncbi:MAG: 50S ribosomal protein L30 [Lachnospira eligens]|uniref:50S ribosomal protein L30 n=1 Tax=Lachnospira eligens TaxID=39485 RepID=UPI003A14A572
MAEKLRITLIKSPIGAVPKHRKTVEAMGLTKMHKTVELPDNAATRGQIQQIGYMLKVEEI